MRSDDSGGGVTKSNIHENNNAKNDLRSADETGETTGHAASRVIQTCTKKGPEHHETAISAPLDGTGGHRKQRTV